jgi:RNAse (barnase) inhibitor barstar
MPEKPKKEYVVDGARFDTLEDAAAEFTRVLGLTMPWQGNLDAFNDFLCGGFGTPDEGFVLVWRGSAVSRERLGYGETIKWLEERAQKCHPTNVPVMQQRVAAARRGEGQTLFDILVEIIQDHEDIDLRLE